ncbi:MAG TPA: extradiol ring-cleavage dioxygenase [Chloroflexota bacterium]|nr:extradiol ring-cleavage dioxygenase [Chloroflexota bacterium]
MARITIGLCTSHSPQLSSPAEVWPRHGENDKGNPWLINVAGQLRSYDQALAEASPRIAAELTAEKHAQRHAAVQAAVAHLQEELVQAKPDVVVVFGDDQAEIFPRDFRPAFMVYSGAEVPNMPYLFTRAPYEAGRLAGWAYGPELATVPISANLAQHLVGHLMARGFDLAHAEKLDDGVGLGHAFGFVFGRIMNGHTVPLVPVIINTLYPPNQPTAQRCWELGSAVREAILSWPGEARVAVVGSGGLSHFLVDEEIDRRFLQALRDRDVEAICALPNQRLQSGTGEIRSWIAAAAAAWDLRLDFTEYQACYRSPAGSGMGMGFAVWK